MLPFVSKTLKCRKALTKSGKYPTGARKMPSCYCATGIRTGTVMELLE